MDLNQFGLDSIEIPKNQNQFYLFSSIFGFIRLSEPINYTSRNYLPLKYVKLANSQHINRYEVYFWNKFGIECFWTFNKTSRGTSVIYSKFILNNIYQIFIPIKKIKIVFHVDPPLVCNLFSFFWHHLVCNLLVMPKFC